VALQMLELVLVYGPPCSGKTRHILETYPSHVRVCPRELYAKEPAMSLHRLIGKVVRQLARGKSVVVDDENRLCRTRRSYIDAVCEKAERIAAVVQVLAVDVFPAEGKQQALWAHEWLLASSAAAAARMRLPDRAGQEGGGKGLSYMPRNAQEFVEWFDMRAGEPPRREEGIMRVTSVTAPLTAATPDGRPFSAEALFLEAGGLFSFKHHSSGSGDGSSSPELRHCLVLREPGLQVGSVLRRWFQERPAAVAVLLLDEAALYPMALEMEPLQARAAKVQRIRRQLQRQLGAWAREAVGPLHCVLAEYGLHEEGSFFGLPRPGMVAWAQRRLGIALERSCIVAEAAASRQLLETAGVPRVAVAKEFFGDASWSVESKLRKQSVDYSSKVPPFLASVRYVLDTSLHGATAPLLATPPAGCIEVPGGDVLLFEEQAGAGRLHWALVDANGLTRALAQRPSSSPKAAASATPMPAPATATVASPRRTMTANAEALSPKAKEPGTLSRYQIELLFGKSVTERGEPYVSHNTLFLRQRTGTRLAACCKGSSNPPYNLWAVVTPLGSLTRSHCSCPVGKEGKCKHVSAMLLSWSQEPEAFAPVTAAAAGNPFMPKPAAIDLDDDDAALVAALDQAEREHTPSPLAKKESLSGGKREGDRAGAEGPRAGKQRVLFPVETGEGAGADEAEGAVAKKTGGGSEDLRFLADLDRELDELDNDGDLRMA